MAHTNKGCSYKKHETGPRYGRWSVWIEIAPESAKARKKLKKNITRRGRRTENLKTRKESFNSDS